VLLTVIIFYILCIWSEKYFSRRNKWSTL